MMEFDDIEMVDFAYHGYFYRVDVDDSLPLDERVPQEVIIFETDCDIQRRAVLSINTMLGANYAVYFPLEPNPNATGTIDAYMPIDIRRGDKFRGEFYGYLVEGVVEFVRPSQLGACSVDIRVNTENE